MGMVWHAHDVLLDRDVAVKELILPYGLDAAGRQVAHRRMLREARSAARLSHPGIVTVHDVVEEDGRPWIVMELVRAWSLEQAVRQSGPLPVSQVAEIGIRVLDALRHAHAAGILHRDVKPGNVLLTTDRVVLTDFGIAAIEGDVTITQTGLLMGSPAYIPPERLQGRTITHAADLWSFGATLYAAVEGRPPYEGPDAVAVLGAVLTQEPNRPQRAGVLLPVIEGLLRKNPADRIGAAQVADMLERVLLAVGNGLRGHSGMPSPAPVEATPMQMLPPLDSPSGPLPSRIIETPSGPVRVPYTNPSGGYAMASFQPSASDPQLQPPGGYDALASTSGMFNAPGTPGGPGPGTPASGFPAHSPGRPGMDTSGPGTSGPSPFGPGTFGPGTSGPGAYGPGTSGPGGSGPSAFGPGTSNPGASGPGAYGPEGTGPGASGSGATGSGFLTSGTNAPNEAANRPAPQRAMGGQFGAPVHDSGPGAAFFNASGGGPQSTAPRDPMFDPLDALTSPSGSTHAPERPTGGGRWPTPGPADLPGQLARDLARDLALDPDDPFSTGSGRSRSAASTTGEHATRTGGSRRRSKDNDDDAPGRGGAMVVVAAVAVIALIVLVLLIMLPGGDDTPDTRATVNNPALTAPGSSAAESGGAEAPIPKGFKRQTLGGVTVAVPLTWKITAEDDGVRLVGPPDSAQSGLIVKIPDGSLNALQQVAKKAAGFDEYTQVTLGPVNYRWPAAEWEYTYRDATNVTIRTITRYIQADDQSYSLTFTAPDYEWSETAATIRQVLWTTFSPA
ncbi:serine/threonine protein kinase [Acrocarpospora macrocephala]|uniref:non-specific serine/threonine protein kinase n=2 Tax=Acrocarpospora macrocephala TaxID=150177 RepID=A0A5M3WZG8_9ACTN|nr:serine/threonine protein kinase [Acrocarpospora macrocephala]